MSASCEINNVQQVPNGNDETRIDIPYAVSELAVPDTRFELQTNTHHTIFIFLELAISLNIVSSINSH